MTEDAIKREAREFAYAWLLIRLLADKIMASPDPQETAEALRRESRRMGRNLTYPGLGPAMSDLMVQEIEDALLQTIDRAAALSQGPDQA